MLAENWLNSSISGTRPRSPTLDQYKYLDRFKAAHSGDAGALFSVEKPNPLPGEFSAPRPTCASRFCGSFGTRPL